MDAKEFEQYWGFTSQEVLDGDVTFGYQEWFASLRASIEEKSQKQMSGATKREKAKYICLSYLACATYATNNTPRDLSDKTYPEFNVALLDLQDEYKGHGEMLSLLNKRYFKDALASGSNNVEAVKIQKEAFRKIFDTSFINEASKTAKINIEW